VEVRLLRDLGARNTGAGEVALARKLLEEAFDLLRLRFDLLGQIATRLVRRGHIPDR
jgi:hypothetical protein